MSVIASTAQEIKTLELATRALIPLELMLSPFPQLYAANADAYSRTYGARRLLTDTELAERVTEYECAVGDAEYAARMNAPAVLSALHGLTWNCLSSAGDYSMTPLTEAACRAVVQSVAPSVPDPRWAGRAPVRVGLRAALARRRGPAPALAVPDDGGHRHAVLGPRRRHQPGGGCRAWWGGRRPRHSPRL